MLLEKVIEEKDELCSSNSQVKHCIDDLRAFICPLRDRNSNNDWLNYNAS
jgi:hypothetical protein